MNKFGIPQSVLDAARGILNKQPVQEDMSVHVAPHADGKSYTVKKVGSAMQKHGGVKTGEKLSDTDIDDLRDSDVTVHHMKEEKETCKSCKGEGCEHCDGKGYHMKEEATDNFGKNFGKRIGMLVKGGKSAEYLKKKADQTRQQNKDLDPGAAKKGLGIGVIDKEKANKKRMAREEAKDLDTDNVDKALQHDCASHVVHKEWGEGQCIPGMHTLVEMEDGSGYVTHYDVLFSHGIEEDVAVEDLEIVKEMSHGHPRKKKKMSEMSSKEKMKKGLYNSKLDPVGQEDDDVDNDGDSDSSDEYLKKRRKAISAAMSKKKVTEASEPQSTGQAGNMAKHYYQLAKKARDSGNQESAAKFMSLAKSMYRKSETMKDRNVQGKQQQVGELYWSDQELEHLNQIDEISTKTLQSYMSKASDARGHRGLPTKKVDNRYAGVKKASDELDKRNKMNEASVVNGVTKKPGEKTWKSTSMSHDDAVKMHGKDNVRIGPRKTGLGKDDVQVHVEASGVRVTKAAKEEPEHIGVQLRKVANIGVNHSGVEFKNGSKEKVSVATANAAMRRYNAAKPAEKEQLQKHMSHSHDALKHIAKGGSLADSPATEKKHPMSAQSK